MQKGYPIFSKIFASNVACKLNLNCTVSSLDSIMWSSLATWCVLFWSKVFYFIHFKQDDSVCDEDVHGCRFLSRCAIMCYERDVRLSFCNVGGLCMHVLQQKVEIGRCLDYRHAEQTQPRPDIQECPNCVRNPSNLRLTARVYLSIS